MKKQEYILCAAIWYNDDKEHISQPTNIKSGYVMCGRRHYNIIHMHYDLTGKKTQAPIATQGFLTSTNRFVDRVEARKIALETNQVLNIKNMRGTELYSEDLY